MFWNSWCHRMWEKNARIFFIFHPMSFFFANIHYFSPIYSLKNQWTYKWISMNILQIHLCLLTDSLMFTLKFINLCLKIHYVTLQNQNPKHQKIKPDSLIFILKFINLYLEIHSVTVQNQNLEHQKNKNSLHHFISSLITAECSKMNKLIHC